MLRPLLHSQYRSRRDRGLPNLYGEGDSAPVSLPVPGRPSPHGKNHHKNGWRRPDVSRSFRGRTQAFFCRPRAFSRFPATRTLRHPQYTSLRWPGGRGSGPLVSVLPRRSVLPSLFVLPRLFEKRYSVRVPLLVQCRRYPAPSCPRTRHRQYTSVPWSRDRGPSEPVLPRRCVLHGPPRPRYSAPVPLPVPCRRGATRSRPDASRSCRGRTRAFFGRPRSDRTRALFCRPPGEQEGRVDSRPLRACGRGPPPPRRRPRSRRPVLPLPVSLLRKRPDVPPDERVHVPLLRYGVRLPSQQQLVRIFPRSVPPPSGP
mmetsp:Transcript_485/g.1130  ORF Transcript_485/g.1130 Transcript_485/m.1130 type:complete len:314 (+) Transcript_485:1310-2251(+)